MTRLDLPFIPDHYRSAPLRELADRVRGYWQDCGAVARAVGLDAGRPRQAGRWRCPSSSCASHTSPALATPRRGGWACHRCGAKGDAVALAGFALGLALPLRGADFARAVEWLAQRAGLMAGEAMPPPLPSPPPVPERPVFDAASWWAKHAARCPTAADWLLSRGIPPGCVSSGIARLDRQGAIDLAGYVSRDFLEGSGGAVVAPMRSAASGAVGALHLRALAPRDDAGKRRTVGSKTDPDGTPRGYGRMDTLRGVSMVILAEGLGDTLATEALADGLDLAVVGADGATCLPAWGAYLSTLPQRPRVVVVAHLDGDTIGADGTGYRRALDAAGAAGGVVMSWAELVRALPAALRDDVLRRMAAPRGWDLADTLAACRHELDALRTAFALAVGLPPPPARRTPRQTQPAPTGTPIATTPAADTPAWTEAEWAELQADLDETWGTQ